MEIPVLVRSLKSSILSSTSFQMGKTFWGVVSAVVEQSRRKARMVARGDGKLGPRGWPQYPSKQKTKKWCGRHHYSSKSLKKGEIGKKVSSSKPLLTQAYKAKACCGRYIIILSNELNLFIRSFFAFLPSPPLPRTPMQHACIGVRQQHACVLHVVVWLANE